MENLSVIVDGINNNERFINKLFAEIGTDFNFDVEKDTVSFHNLNDHNSKLLSNGLAKTILSEFEEKILVKAVNKACENFNKSDKKEIWKITMRQLLEDEYMNNIDYLNRLEKVRTSLEDFLHNSDILSLEGFVNFRLTDYTEELEDAVNVSVQEYLVDLEYKEFVKMLRYFLTVQASRYLCVEIYYGNKIKIIADNKNVTDECVEEYMSELNSIENKDDFVLNSLITIAPKRVKFYIEDVLPQKELVDTIKGVFGDKVTFFDKNTNLIN